MARKFFYFLNFLNGLCQSVALDFLAASDLPTVPANKGGTGRTTWAEGDLLYAKEQNVLDRLPAGAVGQVLTVVQEAGTGTGSGAERVPAWQTPSAGGGGSTTSLFDHYADVGNVGAGEDDLYSDNIPSLGTNGDKICAEYAGTMNVNGTTLRAYFGGTKIFDTGTISIFGTADWELWITIIRESSSVVRIIAAAQINGLGSQEVTYTRMTGLSLSSTVILKITGQGGGVPANNDIVVHFGHIEKKAPA